MYSKRLEWLGMARIDIKNHGKGNDVKIEVVAGETYSITQPHWFSKEGKGYVLETGNKHILLEIECRGTGELTLCMHGIDRRSVDGSRLPLWVDFTRLTVNEELIFWELKPTWHDKAYTYSRYVTDGDKVRVEISWSEHAYRGEELIRLISMW